MKTSVFTFIVFLIALVLSPLKGFAQEGKALLEEAQKQIRAGQYFNAARFAYAAADKDSSLMSQSNALVSQSLMKAGLYQSASYFFIKTLESGDKSSIRKVLSQSSELMSRMGPDVLRLYLVKHTKLDDFDSSQKSAYLYALGKSALLSGDENQAIEALNGVKAESAFYPYALQLRATALALQNRGGEALEDFQDCAKYSDLVLTETNTKSSRYAQQIAESDDLRSRCLAGAARALYQDERFEDADRVYDRIPKASRVWPDVLFEQAWNSFARNEFNRTLGKLVSYKAPALYFVFNSEIEVLKAQTYLSLCLYEDAKKVIDEFTKKYTATGIDVKNFVEINGNRLELFYDQGVRAFQAKGAQKGIPHMAHQAVKSPYFGSLVEQEKSLSQELNAIRSFVAMTKTSSSGLPGFLRDVLKWRKKTIQQLGGAFIKNSLIDYHTSLVQDFEKISFLKLEMLSRAKDKLMRQVEYSGVEVESRERGVLEPKRKDYQMQWSFNGEFWNDELGDYVFGLESECAKSLERRE